MSPLATRILVEALDELQELAFGGRSGDARWQVPEKLLARVEETLQLAVSEPWELSDHVLHHCQSTDERRVARIVGLGIFRCPACGHDLPTTAGSIETLGRDDPRIADAVPTPVRPWWRVEDA